ncbi:MAG: chlorosome envelope protein B [Chlorobiaceae bacterium]|nr:chlorosome envelope protein B [Chlorobiaceae bacterium]
MSNGNFDLNAAVSTLTESAGKLIQLQVDLANSALKTLVSVAEPLAKTATDLIGNVANAANQALQSISAAIAPKK